MNVAALIGSPVAHSLSPAIHDAAFAACGVDWRYVAFDVPAGRADAALEAMRALGLRGLSVTTPHKEHVAACVDELAASAATLRSVNTVTVADDGHLVGHSTDGDGFVNALRAAGIEPAGRRLVVLGAGGAARSVVVALGRSAVADLAVVNRTRDRGEAAAALVNGARVGSLDDVAAAEVVVNATSVGMGSGESMLPAADLHAGQVVADLVYHPLDTALLGEARSAGCAVIDGLSTLVHQAALQQRLWVGSAPAADVLRAAAEVELVRRDGADGTDTLA